MGSAHPPSPKISLFNRQSALAVDLPALRIRARSALPLCIASPAPHPAAHPLPTLPSVEITFIDDAEIARLHLQFMAIPGPTDVITFDHGEILISTETAARQAAEYHHPLADELTLYIIHGLLHLNGHEDASESGAAHMRLLQENILAAVIRSS